jgi:hypothetical protein
MVQLMLSWVDNIIMKLAQLERVKSDLTRGNNVFCKVSRFIFVIKLNFQIIYTPLIRIWVAASISQVSRVLHINCRTYLIYSLLRLRWWVNYYKAQGLFSIYPAVEEV